MSFVCADRKGAGSAEYSDASDMHAVLPGVKSLYLDMTDQLFQGHFLPTAVASAVDLKVIPLGVSLSCNLPTDMSHTVPQHTQSGRMMHKCHWEMSSKCRLENLDTWKHPRRVCPHCDVKQLRGINLEGGQTSLPVLVITSMCMKPGGALNGSRWGENFRNWNQQTLHFGEFNMSLIWL